MAAGTYETKDASWNKWKRGWPELLLHHLWHEGWNSILILERRKAPASSANRGIDSTWFFFSAPSSKIPCLGPLPVQPIPLFHTLSRFGGSWEVQVVTEIGFQQHMAVCCSQLQANVIKQTASQSVLKAYEGNINRLMNFTAQILYS